MGLCSGVDVWLFHCPWRSGSPQGVRDGVQLLADDVALGFRSGETLWPESGITSYTLVRATPKPPMRAVHRPSMLHLTVGNPWRSLLTTTPVYTCSRDRDISLRTFDRAILSAGDARAPALRRVRGSGCT